MDHNPEKDKQERFERQARRQLRKKQFSAYLKHLRDKGRWHWTLSICLIIVGVVVEHVLDSHLVWERARYAAYHVLQAKEIHPIRPKRTTLVVIGDDEYWNGELARRVPIKRDYLARVVSALDKGEPCEIILDFDFESPAPQSGAYEAPAYSAETKILADTIIDVSSRRKIVLPRTIEPQGALNVREPAVLDNYNFDSARIGQGYINLPEDMREIPLTAPLKGGGKLDSLATAAVRLIDPQAVVEAEGMRGDSLPFGTFIEPEKFKTLTTTEVLNADPRTLKSKIECSLVIVGGVWHKDAYGRGKQADAILTPAGNIAGVFAHANFIEALLDSRTFRPLAMWQRIFLGVGLSLLLAVTMASPWRSWVRVTLVLTISALPVMISYFFRQNLGVFFDFFLPSVMVLVHWIVVRK